MIEAGDFSPGKVYRDLAKLKRLNKSDTNWFLAFFRKAPVSADPTKEIQRSFKRKNGLKSTKVKFESSLARSFDVFRPNGTPDKFGVVLLRGK